MVGRLSVGVLIAGLLVGTAYGPLAMLRDVQPDQLADAGYWREVAAATLRSAAATGLSLGGIVAAALGLPMLRQRGEEQSEDGGERVGRGESVANS